MSISASSKILASDVSGKIDTAGTGLSKSGTSLSLASLHSANATIGSSSAQTLAYSGTFTIPYVTRDTYGRVTGGGTRTITMPATPSGGTADIVSTDSVSVYKGAPYQSWTLPSGGTWKYYRTYWNDGATSIEAYSVAGGTSLASTLAGIAIKVA